MPPADEKTGGKEGFRVFTELADSAKVIADIDITQGKGCRSLTFPALKKLQSTECNFVAIVTSLL